VPFFRFLYLRDSSANLSIDTVTASQLPFDYVNTPNDTTGKAPMFKGLRAVIVSYIVTNGLTGAAERTRPLSLVAPFPNMANRELRTCGNDPVNMNTPAVALDADGHSVDVTWNANGDETGGEHDIVNYLLWRRVAGDSVWHAPFVAVPAGSPPAYTFIDSSVRRTPRACSARTGSTRWPRRIARRRTPIRSSRVARSTCRPPHDHAYY
jgi:hypothetical protein